MSQIFAGGGGGGGSTNTFHLIQPDSGTSPTASSSTDTLTLTSSDASLSVVGDATAKSIDFKAAIFLASPHAASNLFFGLTGNTAVAGINNVAMGSGALGSLSSGNNHIAIGTSALAANTDGYENIAIGTNCLAGAAHSADNVMIGRSTGYGFMDGTNNAVVGAYAFEGDLHQITGSNNSILGTRAFQNLRNDVTGASIDDNCAVGYAAGSAYQRYYQCTLIGSGTETGAIDITNSSALGYGALVKSSNTIRLGNTSVAFVETDGALDLLPIATPAAPATGRVRIYVKSSDGKLYRQNSSGTETLIG